MQLKPKSLRDLPIHREDGSLVTDELEKEVMRRKWKRISRRCAKREASIENSKK